MVYGVSTLFPNLEILYSKLRTQLSKSDLVNMPQIQAFQPIQATLEMKKDL